MANPSRVDDNKGKIDAHATANIQVGSLSLLFHKDKKGRWIWSWWEGNTIAARSTASYTRIDSAVMAALRIGVSRKYIEHH